MPTETPPATKNPERIVLGHIKSGVDGWQEQCRADLDGVPLGKRHEHIDAVLAYAEDVAALEKLRVTDAELAEALGDDPEFMKQEPATAFKWLDRKLAELYLGKAQSVLRTDSQFPQALQEIFENGAWKALESGSAAHIVLMELYARMLKQRGQLVTRYVDESPVAREHMDSVALLEYRHFAEISDATNDWFIEWFQDGGTILSSDERQQRGFANEVAAIREREGEPVEVPWHEAYQKHTERLATLYEELVRELQNLVDDAEPSMVGKLRKKIDYYSAIAKALRTSDINDWRVADTLLPQQTDGENAPVHIHTIEIGYGGDTIQRIPEASMRFPDSSFEDINQLALQTRKELEMMLRDLLFGTALSDEAQKTADVVGTSVFAARHFMGSGLEMIFKPAGQAVPNETKSRVEGGLDISADPVTLEKRFPLMYEAFKATFGHDMPEVDPTAIAGNFVAAHEFGHVIGLTETTDERIPESLRGPFVEEWHATMGSMVLHEWMSYKAHRDNLPAAKVTTPMTIEDLKASILWHIGSLCRYTSMRHEPGAKPYARKSFMIMNLAEEVGLLRQEGDEWKINLEDDANVEAFYARLQEDYVTLLTIYDTGTETDLRAFLAERLKPTPFLEFVARKLDAHFKPAKILTVAELCELPAAA